MTDTDDTFALPENNVVPTEQPYIEEQFPQVDPNKVEDELLEQFKEMQENMPAQDVAAHFFKMYYPIYGQLLNGLSNKDLQRVAKHVVQWPLEEENPFFNDDKAKQAFAVGIRLNDCKLIMRSFVEMERQQQILVDKAKAEQEQTNTTEQSVETKGEESNGQ